MILCGWLPTLSEVHKSLVKVPWELGHLAKNGTCLPGSSELPYVTMCQCCCKAYWAQMQAQAGLEQIPIVFCCQNSYHLRAKEGEFWLTCYLEVTVWTARKCLAPHGKASFTRDGKTDTVLGYPSVCSYLISRCGIASSWAFCTNFVITVSAGFHNADIQHAIRNYFVWNKVAVSHMQTSELSVTIQPRRKTVVSRVMSTAKDTHHC